MLKRQTVPARQIESLTNLEHMWSALRDPWLRSTGRIRCVLLDVNQVPRPYPVDVDVSATPEKDRLVLLLDVVADMIEEFVPHGSVAVQFLSAQAASDQVNVTAWTDIIARELGVRGLDAWPVFVSDGPTVWLPAKVGKQPQPSAAQTLR